MKVKIVVGILLSVIICYCRFFPDTLAAFLFEDTPTSPVDNFRTNEIKTWFNFDIEHDVLVFLHIQKTGGKMFDSILVHSLKLEQLCPCAKRLPGGCRCRSANGHIWLYSRLSTNWMCGVHADWTELHECVPKTLNALERNYKSTQSNRRYHYITILREPVSRYISEWLHTRRGANWPILHKCHGYRASSTDFTSCHKGLTWINVTLKAFMDCPTNPAQNRQTYMLADTRQVNCYNLTRIEDYSQQKWILLSAKNNLKSMPYYALMDFMKESLVLLQNSMGIALRREISKPVKSKAKLIHLDKVIINKIKELNRLDIELYAYAKKLFFLRLKAVRKWQKSHTTIKT